MAEQQHTTTTRKVGLSSHIGRPNRLGDLLQGRSPPASSAIDDGSPTPSSSLAQNMSSPSQDIWGRPSISSTIASTFKSTHNDNAYMSPVTSTFEPKHGSSSLHPSDYDAWSSIQGKNTRAWNGETSPVMSSSHLTDGLSRSPIRSRANQPHEPTQSNTDDHVSSPYSVFMTQHGASTRSSLSQSASNKIMLDSSAGLMESFGVKSPTFGPASARFGSDASLTYQPNSGFSGSSQSALHSPSFVPPFAISRNQYEDLTRETREAEIIASQVRHLKVDPNEQDKFASTIRRSQYASFPQVSQGAYSAFPAQPPQFGDLGQYSRQPILGVQDQNAWLGDESLYTTAPYGSDSIFPDGVYINGSAQRSIDLTASPRGDQMSPTASMSPTQLLLREQAFNRAQFGVPYGFSPFRVPIETPYAISLNSQALGNQNLRRPDDYPQSLRSSLLEEFRSNQKGNKRYELRDIYTHVVEFSGDQHGSRFIQQKIETANSEEKEIVFQEIRANCLQLMTDVFGNYVIQKFFEHGSQLQKSLLAKQMEGHVLTLSLQMYGCRVVQKALEHILVDQQASLVKELDGHVLKCVKDQNGNHVVQKAIERVPAEHIQFIINAFTGQVNSLATHPYGCRVIQRMLEHCDEEAQASLLAELHGSTYTLVQDQYGNYVTQHVIEHGEPEDRAKIIQLVTTQLLHFSKHKFASNVVEKSIVFGSDEQRREIVKVITTLRSDGSSPLQVLMRDQYGNYVIQKLLMQLKGKDWDLLADQVKPQLQALKKYTHGKQINAIEKLLFNSSSSPKSRSASPPKSQTITPPPSSGTTTPPPTNSQSSRTVESTPDDTKEKSNEDPADSVSK